MPNIENQENLETRKYKKPSTLDREQLEYVFGKTLSYLVIIFASVLGCASVAYMTVQQLKK
jgi:hypothetical protein